MSNMLTQEPFREPEPKFYFLPPEKILKGEFIEEQKFTIIDNDEIEVNGKILKVDSRKLIENRWGGDTVEITIKVGHYEDNENIHYLAQLEQFIVLKNQHELDHALWEKNKERHEKTQNEYMERKEREMYEKLKAKFEK
jgi:hypothetical protein